MNDLIRFWQVVVIDMLLSGDNAVVIALACRGLPRKQVERAVLGGMIGAVAIRLSLVRFAAALLTLPFLRIAGALMLLWIAVKLVLPAQQNSPQVKAGAGLWGAIVIIVVADISMSLDNVVAVAGVAADQTLAMLGILISVPMIVWGSKIVLNLLDRFPAIVTAGAGMIGWVAGAMWLQDPLVPQLWQSLHYLSAATVMLLILLASAVRRRPPLGELK